MDLSGIYNNSPIMFKIMLEGISPSTWVGVSAFKAQIDRASLAKYGNDVEKMVDDMYST